MSDERRVGACALTTRLVASAALVLFWSALAGCGRESQDAQVADAALPSIDEPELRSQCGSCHAFPEPSVLSKLGWSLAILAMQEVHDFTPLTPVAVLDWYEARAPDRVAVIEGIPVAAATDRFVEKELRLPRKAGLSFIRTGGMRVDAPALSHLTLVDLVDDARLELVATDMGNGAVWLMFPYAPERAAELLARIPFPGHSRMTDLDGDGRKDLLVADLGSFRPSGERRGQVIWLRGMEGGGFASRTLGTGMGRIADVVEADLDGDGLLEIVAAEFGSRMVGRVLIGQQVLNEDGATYRYEPLVLDERAGAMRVVVDDVNGDGLLDIVALHAEHHETFVVHYNEGGMKFSKRDLWSAPHPAWGFSNLEPVVSASGSTARGWLLSNGDGFDAGGLLQPFHGVRWMSIVGGEVEEQQFLPLRGAHHAEAADIDGDGDLDVVASAFQPFMVEDDWGEQRLDGVVWFERGLFGRWQAHSLAGYEAMYPSLVVGDYDLDGDMDILAGRFYAGRPNDGGHPVWESGAPRGAAVRIWENRGD